MNVLRSPVVLAGFLLAAGAAGACASSDGLVLDMLRPGTNEAVGLGGDPFLDPLRDGTGWWGEFVSLPGRSVGIGGSFGKPVTEAASGDWGTVSHGEVSLRFSHEQSRKGLRMRWGGIVRRPRTSGSWDGATGEFHIIDREARAEAGVRISDVGRRIDLQATVPLWRENRAMPAPAGRVGLRWRPWKGLVLQAEGGRSAQLQTLSFDVEGDPGTASLNSWAEDGCFEGSLRLPGGFRVACAVERTNFVEIDPVRNTPEYQLMPHGSGGFDRVDASWGRGGESNLLYRYTRADYDLEGDAYWSYERFGLLNYGEAGIESHLVGLQGELGRFRWVGDVEYVKARGKARAKVEFWPFTEALIDLVGPRRTYRAVGKAEWTGIHAGIESDGNRPFRWQAGLNGYDIRPDFYVESWRPSFLVFGRSDYERNDLNVERLRLAALSLGGELEIRGITARLEVQQFVYAHVTKTPSDGDPGGDGGNGTDSKSEPGSWSDGSRLRFRLVRAF